MAQQIIRDFANVTDYLAYLAAGTPKARSSHEDTGREGFFKTKTYADAEALVTTGWAEGAAKVAARREGFGAFLAAAKSAKSRRFGYDVVGDYIDVGRYMTGEPETFGTEFEDGESNNGRIVSIRLNSCVSGSVSADSIIARGVTTLVAVDLLEACGIRCEVILAQAAERPAVDHNIVVKSPGEQVDVDRLAFWLAHPSAFRRFGFRAFSIEGASVYNCGVGKMSDYGQRKGVVELDSVKTATGLSDRELKRNVLEIAKSCGLQFEDDQVEQLLGA